MTFTEIIGGATIICYILAIAFNNSGLGALALGLTIYAMNIQT